MFVKSFIGAVAFSATSALAAMSYEKVAEPGDSYKEFKDLMDANYPGYTYEFYEVTSEDGYITTLIHLLSNDGSKVESYKDFTPSRGPVLVYNGAGSTVMTWFHQYGSRATPYSTVKANFESKLVNDGSDAFNARLEWLESKKEALDEEPNAERIAKIEDVYKRLVTDAELTPNEGVEALTEEAKECVVQEAEEHWEFYLSSVDKTGAAVEGEMTSKPTLPMALFNFGFDVWLAGYRGHTYNKKHTGDTETTSMFADEPDTYWNFSKQQFATKDMPAQINAINAVTSEQVSLVGYSMGGATIMQFLGLAEVAGNDDLAAEYAKVNRVSLIAACPMPISLYTGTEEEQIAQAKAKIEKTSSGPAPVRNYLYDGTIIPQYQTDAAGEFVVDDDGNKVENADQTETFYREFFCGSLPEGACFDYSQYLYMPALGIDTVNEFEIQAVEQQAYQSYDIAAYLNGDAPGVELDFKTITGPQLFFHFMDEDEICYNSPMFSEIPATQKTYNYKCASHMLPLESDTASAEKLIYDVVIAMGASTLMAGAALAASTMALF